MLPKDYPSVIRLAFEDVSRFYGDRCAERSGVPLINHIKEGINIMRHRHVSINAIAAYALHPMLQPDEELAKNGVNLAMCYSAQTLMFALEYRNIANAWLSDKVSTREDAGGCIAQGEPKLSPLYEVNEMLIADKVQNYADFLTYHSQTHPRRYELATYFEMWLKKLGVLDDFIVLNKIGKQGE